MVRFHFLYKSIFTKVHNNVLRIGAEITILTLMALFVSSLNPSKSLNFMRLYHSLGLNFPSMELNYECKVDGGCFHKGTDVVP